MVTALGCADRRIPIGSPRFAVASLAIPFGPHRLVRHGNTYGAAWQGRYTLPLSMGLPRCSRASRWTVRDALCSTATWPCWRRPARGRSRVDVSRGEHPPGSRSHRQPARRLLLGLRRPRGCSWCWSVWATRSWPGGAQGASARRGSWPRAGPRRGDRGRRRRTGAGERGLAPGPDRRERGHRRALRRRPRRLRRPRRACRRPRQDPELRAGLPPRRARATASSSGPRWCSPTTSTRARSTPTGAQVAPPTGQPVGVHVKEGASLGARSVCVAPVTIGRWAMVGAGAVVVDDVPDFALVVGVPARRVGWVGRAGFPLRPDGDGTWHCERRVPATWRRRRLVA